MFSFITVNVSLSKNKDWFLITAISSSLPVSLSSLLISMDFLVIMFWFSRNTLHIIDVILSSFLPFLIFYDYPNICLIPLHSMISVLLRWSYQANCGPYNTVLYNFILLVWLAASLSLDLSSFPISISFICCMQFTACFSSHAKGKSKILDGLSVFKRNFPILECLSYADSWLKVIWFPCLINKWCYKHVKVMYWVFKF